MAKSYVLPCHNCKKLDYCRKCAVLARQVLFGQRIDPKCNDYIKDDEIEYQNGIHRRKDENE